MHLSPSSVLTLLIVVFGLYSSPTFNKYFEWKCFVTLNLNFLNENGLNYIILEKEILLWLA